MPKKCIAENALCRPFFKKSSSVPTSPTADVKPDMILTDRFGKKWRLGKAVGTGGFGEIFLVSDIINREVKTDAQYVAKVENHKSGPLFAEIHCYINIARLEMINGWKNKMGIKHLGIPHHVAFGSHVISGIRYRFLIIPRFESDLGKMFEIKRHKFNLKTVLTICLQIIDVLQYIHSNGYLHLDIKASNIGFNSNKKINPVAIATISSRTTVCYNGCKPVRICRAKKLTSPRVLRPNNRLRTFCESMKHDGIETIDKQVHDIDYADKIYLLDYGLACKYINSDGTHKGFSKDQRRAHAGTLLFCSRDAHLGAQSRRSDLECLGYNLIYWLTTNLPWSETTDDPDAIYKKKLHYTKNVKEFVDFVFDYDSPNFVFKYFNYLLKLDFEEEPDYNYCKNIFINALKEYGYKNDMCLDFDNAEGWKYKQKKIKSNFENFKVKCGIQKFKLTPLNSNRPLKPMLRRGVVNKKLKQRLNWSKILLDPEVIIKKAKCRSRERKITESIESNAVSSGIMNLDINRLNPTATMLEVFNRSLTKFHNIKDASSLSRDDCVLEAIEGYTPAMMEIVNRKRIRENMFKLNMLDCKSSTLIRNKLRKSNSSNKSKKQEKGHISKTNIFLKKKNAKNSRVAGVRKIYSLRG